MGVVEEEFQQLKPDSLPSEAFVHEDIVYYYVGLAVPGAEAVLCAAETGYLGIYLGYYESDVIRTGEAGVNVRSDGFQAPYFGLRLVVEGGCEDHQAAD